MEMNCIVVIGYCNMLSSDMPHHILLLRLNTHRSKFVNQILIRRAIAGDVRIVRHECYREIALNVHIRAHVGIGAQIVSAK